MSFTHNATVKDALANIVLTAIGNAGFLEFRTAASARVARLTLGSPAGTVTGGVLNFSVPTSDNAAIAGTVDRWAIMDSGTTDVLTGGAASVATAVGAGVDIVLSSLSVGGGDTVSCSQLSYTAPD